MPKGLNFDNESLKGYKVIREITIGIIRYFDAKVLEEFLLPLDEMEIDIIFQDDDTLHHLKGVMKGKYLIEEREHDPKR